MNAISKQSDTRPILSPQNFDQLVRFSEFAANSDLMPRDYKGKPGNIFIAVQMGSELGLAPMQAINSIAVINGRPGVWGDGMIGLCRQSPLCEDIREWTEGEGDERTAYCEVKRRGAASPILGKFSVADAKKASLWSKQGPWTQYPDRMLQNRARGFALRDAFPDLLRGLRSVEELQDIPAETRPEPKPVKSTVVQPRSKLDPVAAEMNGRINRMTTAELDTATGGDEPRPMGTGHASDEPPWVEDRKPADKVQAGVDALIARYRACTTKDEVVDITGEPQVAKQRQWLAKHRPELDEMIGEAAGDKYNELVAAETVEEPA